MTGCAQYKSYPHFGDDTQEKNTFEELCDRWWNKMHELFPFYMQMNTEERFAAHACIDGLIGRLV